MNGYSLYDRKALSYGIPFFAVTEGSAVRSLADLVADTNTTPGMHPGDFVLYMVCVFDPHSGQLLPVTPAQHVCDAQSVVPGVGPGLSDRTYPEDPAPLKANSNHPVK